MSDSGVTKSYSYKKKQKLANIISKLKKKEDMINIMNIISEDKVNITENQNGLFLLFDKLNDDTYRKIEVYLESIQKKPITSSDCSSANGSMSTDKKNYTPNFNDDGVNGQNIRYTSKERNIIKREKYENIVNGINM